MAVPLLSRAESVNDQYGDGFVKKSNGFKWRLVLGGGAFAFGFCCLFVGLSKQTLAEPVTVAVAANFLSPLRQLVQMYEAGTPFEHKLVSGSSGGLYAQIVNRAPYDIFLSADQQRPEMLEKEGFAVVGSRFTYAIGRLALWSPAQPRPFDGSILAAARYRKLAVANEKLAPYGMAAMETLQALGLREAVAGKIVYGQSIGQTYQFVATGNAEFGFVALSQLIGQDKAAKGKWWPVPSSLHNPVLQDGLLLKRSAENASAHAFLAFLKSENALRVIRTFGYDTPKAN